MDFDMMVCTYVMVTVLLLSRTICEAEHGPQSNNEVSNNNQIRIYDIFV